MTAQCSRCAAYGMVDDDVNHERCCLICGFVLYLKKERWAARQLAAAAPHYTPKPPATPQE